MCFNGYKLFRLSLGIAGSVAGFSLGRLLIDITGEMGVEWSNVAKIICLAVLTIGLGVLAFKLYMKALIAITTIVCALWFYDDFSFIYERITNSAPMRTASTHEMPITIANALACCWNGSGMFMP